jgi:Family of unknown function (DUF6178)
MSKHDDSTSALARLLDSDHLARVVPELAPETLHQLIRHHGLDACGDLVAAATSEQLISLFDLDLWQAAKPGFDEQLDVARFGEWIEMLVDKDPSLAARTVASIEARLAIAALSRYIRVFDPGVFERTVASEEVDPDAPPLAPFSGPVYELGRYIVRARRNDCWDAIVALLHALQDDHPDRFDEVMRGCRRLSNDRAELDGFHDLLDTPEQFLFDTTLDRENRLSAQGYVTPADARAFLEMARRPRQPNESAQPHQPRQQQPRPRQPSASVWPTIDGPDGPDQSRQSRALIASAAGNDSSQTRIMRAMHHLGEHDAEMFDERMRELAFLAGTLVAGCSLGGRPFTPREAHDAAIAICNIGLERWPGVGFDVPLPDDFLQTHELVAAFEAGWAVLHEEVSLFVADRLIATLRDLRCHDLDTRRGLVVLERELMKHRAAGAPWHARDALDVLAILDMTAWTSLLGLLGECPVLPAALTAIITGDIRPVDAQAFEFISTSDRLHKVRAFMEVLPEVLLR